MIFTKSELPPAGKNYELRRVVRPARGGGGSRDLRSQLFNLPAPIFKRSPPKQLLRPTVSGRAPSRDLPTAAAATPGGRPVPLGTRKLAFSPQSSASDDSKGRNFPACRPFANSPPGPYPLGKNQSLSSPPLEPRGLLLSVMRQKVSKDRSQGDYQPLG